jgi:hypothetical protein
MRALLCSLPLFLLTLCGYAQEPEEVKALDCLIALTERHLETQRTLKQLMLDLVAQKEAFVSSEPSKQQAARLVSTARRILLIINEERYEHLFSSEYLQELAWFASIAGKSAPARP